jgi:Ran GTPase-activating protein (RanGAP) involved in mRNA processing and transport
MQELNLSHNDLVGAEPMVALLSAERICELSLLNLANNSLGDAGASALAVHLQALPNLRTVILESNNIADEGACALAESLPSVHFLALPCCQASNSLAASRKPHMYSNVWFGSLQQQESGSCCLSWPQLSAVCKLQI